MCVCAVLSRSVMLTFCNPMNYSPPGSSCPWDFLGKNTGVGCHALLQGDLPNPGIEPASLALLVDSLPLSHQGSPKAIILQLKKKNIILEMVQPGRIATIPHFTVRETEAQSNKVTHLQLIQPVLGWTGIWTQAILTAALGSSLRFSLCHTCKFSCFWPDGHYWVPVHLKGVTPLCFTRR